MVSRHIPSLCDVTELLLITMGYLESNSAGQTNPDPLSLSLNSPILSVWSFSKTHEIFRYRTHGEITSQNLYDLRPVYSFDGITWHYAPQRWPLKFTLVELWHHYAWSYATSRYVNGINGSAGLTPAADVWKCVMLWNAGKTVNRPLLKLDFHDR